MPCSVIFLPLVVSRDLTKLLLSRNYVNPHHPPPRLHVQLPLMNFPIFHNTPYSFQPVAYYVAALSNCMELSCVKPSKWFITKRWLSKCHKRLSITRPLLAWLTNEIVKTLVPTLVNIFCLLNLHIFAIAASKMFFPMDLSIQILPMRHLSHLRWISLVAPLSNAISVSSCSLSFRFPIILVSSPYCYITPADQLELLLTLADFGEKAIRNHPTSILCKEKREEILLAAYYLF